MNLLTLLGIQTAISRENPLSLAISPTAFSWDWFESVLQEKLPSLYKSLHPPASLEQVIATEQIIGYELPAFVRQAYLRHDGSDGTQTLFLPNFSWCSLAAMQRKWHEMRERIQENMRHAPHLLPAPDEAWSGLHVRPVLHDDSRIPLSDSDSYQDWYIDLMPGPKGVVGQIIQGNLSENAFVVANSLQDYLLAFGTQIACNELREQSSKELVLRHGLNGPFLKKLDCAPQPNDMQTHFEWTWFEQVLARHLPARARLLADGIAEEKLRWFEQKLGCSLPPFLRQAYAKHDGSGEHADGLIPPEFSWMNLQEAWCQWGFLCVQRQRVEQGLGVDPNRSLHHWSGRSILPQWWGEHFLPIARGQRWNLLFVDLRQNQPDGSLALLIDTGADEPLIYAPSLERFWLALGNRLANGELRRINFPPPEIPIQQQFSWAWFESLIEPAQEKDYGIQHSLALRRANKVNAQALLDELQAASGFEIPPLIKQAYLHFDGTGKSDPPVIARTEYWGDLAWVLTTWKGMRHGYAVARGEHSGQGVYSPWDTWIQRNPDWVPSFLPVAYCGQNCYVFIDMAAPDSCQRETLFELELHTGRRLLVHTSIEEAFLSYADLLVSRHPKHRPIQEISYAWHDQDDRGVTWLNTTHGSTPNLAL